MTEDTPMDLPTEGTRWRHYKGGIYTIVGHATHTETGETLILYRAEDDDTTWARPVGHWNTPPEGHDARFSPHLT